MFNFHLISRLTQGKLGISRKEITLALLKVALILLIPEGCVTALSLVAPDLLNNGSQLFLKTLTFLIVSFPLMMYFVILPYMFRGIGQATKHLEMREERYALAVKGANDGLWDWNLETEEIYYSERFREILGWEKREEKYLHEDWAVCVHPDDRQRFMEAFQACQHKGESDKFHCEYRILQENGNYIWVLTRWVALYDENNKAKRYVGSQREITARKAVEERLVHDAFHDHLTKLPNRILFNDQLEQTLVQFEHDSSCQFAVLCIDIDDFKSINDSLGHQAGDDLLIEVAHRLRGRVRAGDTVARLGGDEFAIVLNDVHSGDELQAVLARLSQSIVKYFASANQKVPITLSMGVVHVTSQSPYESATDILRDADIALYRAKGNGKNCFAFFQEDMHLAVKRNFELTHSLREAIEGQNMFVYYQPIVHLRSMKLAGFEALARWHHPQLGWIPPGQFISLAEESGMIKKIGQFVMESACRQLVLWRENLEQAKTWFITINVSAKQLESREIVEFLGVFLKETGVSADLIKLEITENILISHNKHIEENLLKIKGMGVKIAIDDFGTGYSSLNTLNTIPFDILKIDRAFINDLNENKKSQNMVQFITILSQALKMESVAEGIEKEEQLAYLQQTKCRYGQGYFFGAPMPAEYLEQMDYFKENAVVKNKVNVYPISVNNSYHSLPQDYMLDEKIKQ